MYTEHDLLPISALQHLIFCERQCALIHLEGEWEESRLTAEGRLLHDRAHGGETEVRGEVRIARGVRVRSLALGLVGQADVVEFHLVDSDNEGVTNASEGVHLQGAPGRYVPYPVEYKRGKPKANRSDEVQLCAQAMCLEEMLGCTIREGALYYGRPHRRTVVGFEADLREATAEAARRLHEVLSKGMTPPAVYEKKCRSCSLLETCLPKVSSGGRKVERYLEGLVWGDGPDAGSGLGG